MSDRAIAAALATDLRCNGIDVWWDAALPVGSSWSEEIKSRLVEADLILVLVTPASVESQWVTHEWSTALAESKLVVPVVVGGAFELLAGPLAGIQAAVYQPGDGDSISRLVRGIIALLEPSDRSVGHEQEANAIADAKLDEEDVARIVEMTVRQMLDTIRTNDRRESVRPSSSLVFVITSFDPDMEPMFEAVQVAAAAVGLEAKRVKDVQGDFRITDKILAMIEEARVVVADLTHERPNVYFELGYARGLGKSVVTILRDTATAHFDVQHWTSFRYSDSRPLERELRQRFEYELKVEHE